MPLLNASKLSGFLAPRKIGAIYVWVLMIVIFSALSPESFARESTVRLILNQYAVTGLIAIGLLLPLCAGLFDLSIGAVAGMAGLTAAWMMANVTANPVMAVTAGLAVALLAGLINSLVVLVMGVDSFIGTLATGSIFLATSIAVSGDTTINKHIAALTNGLALSEIGGVTTPVLMMLTAMLVAGYVLEKTAFGRRTYAIGFDIEAARLGGVQIRRVRMVTLLTASFMAGLAGITVTAQLGAGSSSTGPGYLLPAFAAAFLGATQFRGGRFNPWGAVLAVLLVGTGNVGLLSAGAPRWAPEIFNGVLLIVAVTLTSTKGIGALRSLRRRLGSRSPAGELSSGGGAEDVPLAAGQAPVSATTHGPDDT